MSATAFAIILAGGGGTRLWPASRRVRPKQLLHLGGGESLLAAAVRRAGAFVPVDRILIVTAADQAEAVARELPELPADNIIVEPAPRNTAAAVGLGAVVAHRRAGADALLAVLPADPHIADEAGFTAIVKAALAEAGRAITTIGIQPTHAETGFGYIRVGPRIEAPGAGDDAAIAVHQVAAFVEKPDRATAERYIASGDHLWNSGMFFLTAGRMLEEAQRHLPALGDALGAMVAAADFDAAVAARYPDVPAISIDSGIMEKASGLRVVPGSFGWNDVGSWAAMPAIRATDARGNVVVGQATVLEGSGNVIVSHDGNGDGNGNDDGDGGGAGGGRRAPFVGVFGVNDLIVIATADAVLVIPKDRAQDVRQIVEAARKAGRHDLL
jgi:mannose-1-phosphate guanylyltransferase